MNREDIIKLAREAGWPDSLVAPIITSKLVEFAALVKQHLIQQGYRKCAEGQRETQHCALLEEAVRREREKK